MVKGLLWALGEIDGHGTVDGVDQKKVLSSNLNGCLYFDADDVSEPKAEVLGKKFKHPYLALWPAVLTFAEPCKKRRMRRAAPTTDSRAAGRSVRNQLPLEIIDALTTGITEVVTFIEKQPTDGVKPATTYLSRKNCARTTNR